MALTGIVTTPAIAGRPGHAGSMLSGESKRKRCVRWATIACGASLKLLQMSGIPEARDYAGFPVGGQFLAFEGPALTARHGVKVYGKAEAGSPPMSVPHLDARRLDGKSVVLFGPFALQSTKFLKQGSWQDLFNSVYGSNVGPMMAVGTENAELIRYLVQQATLSDADRPRSCSDPCPGDSARSQPEPQAAGAITCR